MKYITEGNSRDKRSGRKKAESITGTCRTPEFATQIAGMIVVAINGTLPKQKTEANTVMGLGLLAQMIAAGQGEPEKEGTENKKKK